MDLPFLRMGKVRYGMGRRGLQGYFKTLVGTEFFCYGGSTLNHMKHIQKKVHPTLTKIFGCKFFERMFIILLSKLFGPVQDLIYDWLSFVSYYYVYLRHVSKYEIPTFKIISTCNEICINTKFDNECR